MVSVSGLVYASLAALLWGFVPVYIGYLGDVDPMEIVVHRALWSGVILLGLVTLVPSLFGGLKDARAALATRMRLGFLLTCALLSVNWIVFVYAVQARQVFDAALGYFIYPLVTVVLGILVLRERLDPLGMGGCRHCWLRCCPEGCPPRRCAVDCSCAGAVLRALWRHQRMTVNPVIGMFVETVFLIPLSVIYLAWRHDAGQTIFFGGGAVNVTLAVFAGVVTVVPLLLYHAGNRALPISVASLLFYINPTTQLVVGLVYFDLVATPEEWLVFGLIWTGLVLYFASRRRGGASVNHAR